MRGVRLELLQKWGDDYSELTTQQMALIIRKSIPNGESFLDFLENSDVEMFEVDHPVGVATHVLCYSQDILFGETIKSMVKSINKDENVVYVWIDMLCLESSCRKDDWEGIRNGVAEVHKIVKTVGRTICVIDRPEIGLCVLFRQAWCLYLLACTQSDQIQFALSDTVQDGIFNLLLENPQDIYLKIDKIDGNDENVAADQYHQVLLDEVNDSQAYKKVNQHLCSWVSEILVKAAVLYDDNIHGKISKGQDGFVYKNARLSDEPRFLKNMVTACIDKGLPYRSALKCIQTIIERQESISNDSALATSMCENVETLAMILLENGNPDESISWLRKSLEILLKMNISDVSQSIWKLAQALVKAGNTPEAKNLVQDYVGRCKSTFEQSNSRENRERLIDSLEILGRYFTLIENHALAIDAFEQCLFHMTTLKSSINPSPVLQELVRLCAAVAEFKKLFEYGMKFLQALGVLSSEYKIDDVNLVRKHKEAVRFVYTLMPVDKLKESQLLIVLSLAQVVYQLDLQCEGRVHIDIVDDLEILSMLENALGNIQNVEKLNRESDYVVTALVRIKFKGGPGKELQERRVKAIEKKLNEYSNCTISDPERMEEVAEMMLVLGDYFETIQLEKAISCYIETIKLKMTLLRNSSTTTTNKEGAQKFEIRHLIIRVSKLIGAAPASPFVLKACLTYVKLVRDVFSGPNDTRFPLMMALKKYGLLLEQLGYLEDASEVLEEALKIAKECEGGSEVTTLSAKLVECYLKRAKYDDAIRTMQELVDEKIDEDDHEDYAKAIHELACLKIIIAFSSGDAGHARFLGDAESLLLESLDILIADDSDFEVQCTRTLSQFYARTGRIPEALERIQHIIDIDIYERDEEREDDTKFAAFLKSKLDQQVRRESFERQSSRRLQISEDNSKIAKNKSTPEPVEEESMTDRPVSNRQPRKQCCVIL